MTHLRKCSVSSKQDVYKSIVLDDIKLEIRNKFIYYLESKITRNGRSATEIRNRIAQEK